MSLKITFFVTGIILVGVFFINYRNLLITNNPQWIYMMIITAFVSLGFIIVSQFIDKPYNNIEKQKVGTDSQ